MREDIKKLVSKLESLIALDITLSHKDWEFINNKIKEIKEKL